MEQCYYCYASPGDVLYKGEYVCYDCHDYATNPKRMKIAGYIVEYENNLFNVTFPAKDGRPVFEDRTSGDYIDEHAPSYNQMYGRLSSLLYEHANIVMD